MANQALKQDARRKVQETLAAKQAERLARERRLRDQAIVLLAAIAERDQAITLTEQQAGQAIRAMLADKLTLDEVADWCGGELDPKELHRLSRLAANQKG